MAIPETMTTSDISGRWVLNKTLSDSTDPIFTAQGISWFTRKTIGLATINVDIKHYITPDDGLEHIDAFQTLTGGIKGTDELRVLHGIERDHTDHLFGSVKSISKRVSYKELPEDVAENAFLHEGWTADTTEAEKGMIYTRAVSTEKDWTVVQMWGFEMIDGEKRYTRHAHLFTPTEKINAKLIYDYMGPIRECSGEVKQRIVNMDFSCLIHE